MLLEDLVHSEMYPLDNVPAVVEDPANIFRVHGAGEVGIAVVGGVLPGVPLRGLKYFKKKLLSYEKSKKRKLKIVIYIKYLPI